MSSSQLNAPAAAPSFPEGSIGGRILPVSYGMVRLVLLARDPAWLHAYWDLGPDPRSGAERLFGTEVRSGRTVLRLVPGDGGAPTDVDVFLDARSWYARVPSSSARWRAELGFLMPDGRFLMLVASNEVSMPAGRLALEEEESGLETGAVEGGRLVRSRWARLFELSGGGRQGPAGTSMESVRALRLHLELLSAMSCWSGSPQGPFGAGERRELVRAD